MFNFSIICIPRNCLFLHICHLPPDEIVLPALPQYTVGVFVDANAVVLLAEFAGGQWPVWSVWSVWSVGATGLLLQLF